MPAAVLGYAPALLIYAALLIVYAALLIAVMALTMSHHPARPGAGGLPSAEPSDGLPTTGAEPLRRAADGPEDRSSRGQVPSPHPSASVAGRDDNSLFPLVEYQMASSCGACLGGTRQGLDLAATPRTTLCTAYNAAVRTARHDGYGCHLVRDGDGATTIYAHAEKLRAGQSMNRRLRTPDRSMTMTKTKKDPLWARLTVVLGALLMMGSGVGIAGSKMLIGKAASAVTSQDLLGDTKKTEAEGGSRTRLDGPIDLLLMGVDARARWAVDDLRADTIIILHIPENRQQAYLVSIPRDTEVRVPPFAKSGYGGGITKANESFFYGAQNGGGWAGGAQLMAQTLKDATGISFDGAGIIDFNGFKGVIDSLGGVSMCLDQKVTSAHMYMVNGKPMYKAEARQLGQLSNPVTYAPAAGTWKVGRPSTTPGNVTDSGTATTTGNGTSSNCSRPWRRRPPAVAS